MKKLTKIIMSSAVIAALGCSAAFSFTACSTSGLEINIEGSTSMEDVMTALAEAFSEKYEAENGESVTINITANGSGSGIEAASSGRADFGMASRELKDDESSLTSQTVCLDGISVVVNSDCALDSVTKTQLVNLYTQGTAIEYEGGSIVAALRREASSGTRDGFQSAIGIDDEDLYSGTGFDEYTSTGALKTAIAGNSAGTMLGYISMASVDSSVKALAYDAEDGNGAVEPTAANVLNGTYALSRPFIICYQSYEGLSDIAKEFIEFIMSEEGQQICVEEGCISEVLGA